MSDHRQFCTLGYVLMEYLTKIALSRLPQTSQERYTRLLALAGVDVRGVGLTTIGQTLLTTAMTGASFSSSSSHCSIQGEVGALLDAACAFHDDDEEEGLPLRLPKQQHRDFVRRLRRSDRRGGGMTAAVVWACACAAYGKHAAVWAVTHEGLPPALVRRLWDDSDDADHGHDEAEAVRLLEGAYAAWKARSQCAAHTVRQLGGGALREYAHENAYKGFSKA
jgi:hypothetical protein